MPEGDSPVLLFLIDDLNMPLKETRNLLGPYSTTMLRALWWS